MDLAEKTCHRHGQTMAVAVTKPNTGARSQGFPEPMGMVNSPFTMEGHLQCCNNNKQLGRGSNSSRHLEFPTVLSQYSSHILCSTNTHLNPIAEK